MIIHLNKSKIFTVEPAKRFAKEFNVPDKVWLEIWLRYKLQDYTIPELIEYTHIRTGRKPSYNSIDRWITRTEIYSRSIDAVKMGVTTVVSSFFGKYEQDVINEITRNMMFSGKQSSRSML